MRRGGGVEDGDCEGGDDGEEDVQSGSGNYSSMNEGKFVPQSTLVSVRLRLVVDARGMFFHLITCPYLIYNRL